MAIEEVEVVRVPDPRDVPAVAHEPRGDVVQVGGSVEPSIEMWLLS